MGKIANGMSNRYSRTVGRDTAGGRDLKTSEIRIGYLTNKKVWKCVSQSMVKLQKTQGILRTKSLSVWPESFPVRTMSVNILCLGNILRERVEVFLPAKESLNYLFLTRGRKKILRSKAFCRDLNDPVFASRSATDLLHDLRQVTSPLSLG